MINHDPGISPLAALDEESALRTILEGTANETGERFFAALVENLARALNTHGAWVTEYIQERRRLRALAFWMDGQWIQDYETDIAGTPCERVIDSADIVHFPDNLFKLFPDDPDITAINAVSYLGMPLKDVDGKILGHLAVIDRRPIPEEPKVQALFRILPPERRPSCNGKVLKNRSESARRSYAVSLTAPWMRSSSLIRTSK